MWHVFRTRKSRRQFTTISHQFTTKTPQIDHQKTPTFSETPPKTPLKNTRKIMKILTCASVLIFF